LSGGRTVRTLLQEFNELRRSAAYRFGTHVFAVVSPESAHLGSAQPGSLFEHRIEHWSEVAGRRIDDLHYLRSGGLLFQGLARLGQKPCVLHRDDRLRRKILQQRDLFVGKQADFLPIDDKHSEECTLFAQRDHQLGAGATHLDDGASRRVGADLASGIQPCGTPNFQALRGEAGEENPRMLPECRAPRRRETPAHYR
jgi:hypothetical protein